MGPFLGGILAVLAVLGAFFGIKSMVAEQNAFYAEAVLVKMCGDRNRMWVYKYRDSFVTSNGVRVEKPETVCPSKE